MRRVCGQLTRPTQLRWTEPNVSEVVGAVLAVGAGGIGCELLKVLVQSGFKRIEVVRSLHEKELLAHRCSHRAVRSFHRLTWTILR